VAPVRCDLCEASRLTTWYHEDATCWVADCEICDVPMVVWREHAADPPDPVRDHLLTELRAVADARFGTGGYRVDDHMRNIPDHYHAHARTRSPWAQMRPSR